jgi:small subunit ribosomal protein S17
MAASAKGIGRDIGLGVSAPARSCDDRHCPFHGNLPVRGSVFDGEVMTSAMAKTVVVRRQLSRPDPKFERLRRVSRKYSVHAPPCLGVRVGDWVRIGECRPIAKTVSFVVVSVVKAAPVEEALKLPTAKPEEIPEELSARPLKTKRERSKKAGADAGTPAAAKGAGKSA